MVLNLIDTEVEEVKRDNQYDYIETIERMQSIMNELESNKAEMENHIVKLEKSYDKNEKKLEELIEHNSQLQMQYNDILAKNDMSNSKYIELDSQLAAAKKQFENEKSRLSLLKLIRYE